MLLFLFLFIFLYLFNDFNPFDRLDFLLTMLHYLSAYFIFDDDLLWGIFLFFWLFGDAVINFFCPVFGRINGRTLEFPVLDLAIFFVSDRKHLFLIFYFFKIG